MADNNQSYLDLITSEYAEKPKFNAIVKAFIDMLSPSVDNLNMFDELFNLDIAAGDQLDICGNLVGLMRELPIDDADIPAVLSDELFRLVIKARILSNFWDGTTSGLIDIIYQMIPEAVLDFTDNQDMTVSMFIAASSISNEVAALLINGYIVPKPAGVKMTWTVYSAPFFGWDRNTNFIKGWDTGVWHIL